MKRTVTCLFAVIALSAVTAYAQSGKPNILVITTDDVGIWNISAYHGGMTGGRAPNIDHIAAEGALFPVQSDRIAWVHTIPGKGWFTILPLDGPLEPWFDKTWRPGEIKPVN